MRSSTASQTKPRTSHLNGRSRSNHICTCVAITETRAQFKARSIQVGVVPKQFFSPAP